MGKSHWVSRVPLLYTWSQKPFPMRPAGVRLSPGYIWVAVKTEDFSITTFWQCSTMRRIANASIHFRNYLCCQCLDVSVSARSDLCSQAWMISCLSSTASNELFPHEVRRILIIRSLDYSRVFLIKPTWLPNGDLSILLILSITRSLVTYREYHSPHSLIILDQSERFSQRKGMRELVRRLWLLFQYWFCRKLAELRFEENSAGHNILVHAGGSEDSWHRKYASGLEAHWRWIDHYLKSFREVRIWLSVSKKKNSRSLWATISSSRSRLHESKQVCYWQFRRYWYTETFLHHDKL